MADLKQFERKMEKTLEVLASDFGAVRAGRANAQVLERRKELAKQVKKYGEDAKVAIRNVRRDAVDFVKKAQKKGELTEDDQKKAEKDIQDLTDKYVKKVDEMCGKKDKELMEI